MSQQNLGIGIGRRDFGRLALLALLDEALGQAEERPAVAREDLEVITVDPLRLDAVSASPLA